MFKNIDEKRNEITYTGNVEELKVQLGFLFDELIPHWKNSGLEEDIKNFEKITEDSNNFSTLNERIYYDYKRLLYRVNSSSKEAQKFYFPIIKKRCEKADEKFLALEEFSH